jgi:uncharacterized integral membrane protein
VSDDLPTASNRRSARFYITIAAIVVGTIFVLQNTQDVKVKFFFSTTNTPLIFALLFSGAIGLIIGLALPRFRRRD